MRDKSWEAVEMTLQAFFVAFSYLSDVDSDIMQDELMEQLHDAAYMGTDDDDDGFDDGFVTDSDEYDEDDGDGVSVEGMD
jgi:hypothetical protein